jgi:proteasome lid subunit RPN8/RPN11
MAYINQPPDLRVLFSDLERRLRLLETAQRFTVPIVSSDPTAPRNGDLWYNSTTSQLKFKNSAGTIQIVTLT